MKNKLMQIIAPVLIFAAGYATHWALHTCPEVKQTAPTVDTTATTETKTEIVYVPKETIIYNDASGQTVEKMEDTDVEINIAKPDLKVKVNGQPFTIQKKTRKNIFLIKTSCNLTKAAAQPWR